MGIIRGFYWPAYEPHHIIRLSMDEEDFEGTLVLEKLAEVGEVENFFDAIDSDDFQKAKKLMSKAGLDAQTIQTVLNKMAEADGKH